MKKRMMTLLLTAVMMLGLMPLNTIEVKAAGSVSMTDVQKGNAAGSGDTVTISTPDELRAFSDYINNDNDGAGITFKLTQDIVLNDLSDATVWSVGYAPQNVWTAVGNLYHPFKGTFDGDGYAIKGIYINSTKGYQGLFGFMSEATVQNVSVEDSYIKGDIYVGGIVGDGQSSTITNCSNSGTISGNIKVGGVSGYVDSVSTIINCSNTGKVTGTDNQVGGIVGSVQKTSVTNCFNTGIVVGQKNFVGGIVGYSSENSSLVNCFNTGAVSGTDYVGGVAGYSEGNNDADDTNGSSIMNCYNIGKITGTGTQVGSVAGKNCKKSTIKNSYYLITTALSGVGSDDQSVSIAIDGFETDGKLKSDNNGYTKGSMLLDALNNWVATNQTDPASYKTWVNTVFPVYGSITSNVSSIWDGMAATSFAGGDGSKDTPYQISNGQQLAFLAEQVNIGKTYSGKYFVLTNDIKLNDVSKVADWATQAPDHQWTAIGDDTNPFNGIFDGDGFTVSGVYISNDLSNQGLFGSISDAVIQNVDLEYSYIKNDNATADDAFNLGGIVGESVGSTVANCCNTGTIVGPNVDDVGGVVGHSDGGSTIMNCYNTGSVTGNICVGGVAGLSIRSSTITNCYNTGKINGQLSCVGGVAGYIKNSTVKNCYNTGTVDSQLNSIGGVAGADHMSTVMNCYNTGAVSGQESIGGVTGSSFKSSIANCYNTGAVSGSTEVGDVFGDNDRSTVNNCYYQSTKNAPTESGIDSFDSNGNLTTENNQYDKGSSLCSVLSTYSNAQVPVSVDWAVMSPGETKPVLVSVSTHKVTWVVENDSSVEDYVYSSTPTYKGTPTKAADAEYTHEFIGWSPAIDPVTEDVTYTAQFNDIKNKFSVTLSTGTGYTLTSTDPTEVPYGDSYSFTMTLDSNYEKSASFAVKVNGTVVSAVNDVYTIGNITAAQTVTVEGVVLKAADYTAVDNAIAKIPSDLSGYTDESVRALNNAENAVVRGKMITNQNTVDGYADAIEKAINGLTVKTAVKLAAPTGLSWNDSGKASWNASANAESYTVQLYKDGVALGSPKRGITVTSYDFTSEITETGTYSFTVTAVGDTLNYADSDTSSQSMTYSYTEPAAIPETGSSSMNGLWLMLLMMSLGVTAVIIGNKKRKEFH